MAKQLNQKTRDKILSNNLYHTAVADMLGVTIRSLPNILKRNGNKLNRLDNLLGIAEALNLTLDDIVEEVTDTTNVAAL